MANTVLVHLAAGIGNIVLATPLLSALGRMGATIDLWLSADYAETADLFREWSTVRRIVTYPSGSYDAYLPAVPPFYWNRFRGFYEGRRGVVPRPPDSIFWTDEQAYYVSFARALGFTGTAPPLLLPVSAQDPIAATPNVVLAPGCKTGEMAAKRWPWFPELAEHLEHVTIVGTQDDLKRWDDTAMRFPAHARMCAGQLGLRQTAELMAASSIVVANDTGLGYVAAALGVPTILLFGPTPHLTLGRMPAHVTVLRSGLPCEPCWFSRGRLIACSNRVDCLRAISVQRVRSEIARVVPHAAGAPGLAVRAS